MYECEAWTISKQIQNKLEATEMWFLRRMLRIPWTAEKTNERVLNEANKRRSLRRKRLALAFGLFLFVSGCLLIISACALKIMERQPIAVIIGYEPSTFSETSLTSTERPTGDITGAKTTSSIDYTNLYSLNGGKLSESVGKHSVGFLKTFLSPSHPPKSGDSKTFLLSMEDVKTIQNGRQNDESRLVDLSRQPPIDFQNNTQHPAATESSSVVDTAIPLAGILGILGYTLLDVGFDVGNPMVRAFILDHSPPSQHTHLLVLAAVLASMAGIFMSSLGVFDLPGAIEATFAVDGTAGAFILMLIVIIVIVVSFFGCSVWTGTSLGKFKACNNNIDCETVGEYHKSCNPYSKSKSNRSGDKESVYKRVRSFRNRSSKTEMNVTEAKNQRVSWKDSIYTDENVISNDGASLISQGSDNATGKYPSYMSFSQTANPLVEQKVYATFKPMRSGDVKGFIKPPHSHTVSENISENHTTPPSFLFITTSSDSSATHEMPSAEQSIVSAVNSKSIENSVQKDCSPFVKTPHDMYETAHCSLSPKLSELPHERNLSERANANQSSNGSTTNSTLAQISVRSLFTKRLLILIASTMLSVSGLICSVMYSSNTVTLGIYQADPTATLGTPENESYRQGLRTAAKANIVMYVAYFLSCALNNKSFQVLGEKCYFLVCNGLLVASTAILLLTQRVEAYFLMMVMLGAFRTCIFTLPYVLANQFTKPKVNSFFRLQSSLPPGTLSGTDIGDHVPPLKPILS
ncbi:hypothetical protein PoB_000171200 [Plakobranchus ocellatus]|uniref:Uncharacterized protein n=1 Tax=Plakobranchus ocellatus TaxID=259542 RepID=A0AAV3XYK3_9GAST|nr:hypothetical protein PoB_000171200 [Plakobranchus ocellatus]